MDTRLILLEGMPSTGKTTNARFLQMQLERNKASAKWIHEVAMPHPVLFFDEVGLTHEQYAQFIDQYPDAADILHPLAVVRKSTVGFHLPEIQWQAQNPISEEAYAALLKYDAWKFPLEVYQKFALEKWAYFVEKALENQEDIYIIDSAIFQFQIFTFLFKNRPYAVLRDFIDQILRILQPLNPCLLYLYRQNTEETIGYLEKDRGASYLEYMWNRDKGQPYYAHKAPGAESFKQFLRDYGSMAAALFEAFPFKKRALEISDGHWTRYEDEMLAFLGVNRLPGPKALPPAGVYIHAPLGFVIKVEGLSITDPTGKPRKLFPKSNNEFYVDWLPTVLRFEGNQIIIAGLQIPDRWTATGTIYEKSTVLETGGDQNGDPTCNQG